MRKFLFFIPFLFLTFACTQNNSKVNFAKTVQSDLPITKVVLYQNGVGYFERSGKVKGSILNLQIRHDQVMDILKTLTIIDRKGGHAVSISLPVEKNRLAKLGELPPQVRNSGGLLNIARAFRGARCVLKTKKGTHSGRIVGVENLGTYEKPRFRITLLKKGGTLSIHKLSKVRSLRVIDKTLTVGLEKSLDVSLNKGSWKPINLTINLSGKGTHDLVVSYVVEMPIWKPAYRLVVGKNDEILLQGWAVVDNLSGDSWKNTFLNLTAGTPLAFKYDLYTPHNVQRPDLTPKGQRVAEAPPEAVNATSIDSDDDEVLMKKESSKDYRRPSSKMSYSRRRRYKKSKRYRSRSPRKRSSRRGGYGYGGSKSYYSKPKPISLYDMKRSLRTLVKGASISSLFNYEIGRVTIPDRSSALVTIINKMVKGKDVLYYITERNDPTPYRAIKFKNSSGYVLERGPIAIYRKGQFVGEALSGVIQKKATTFVPYAKEGKVIVSLRTKWLNEGEKLLSIWNGVMRVEERSINKFIYEVRNNSGEEFTIFVRRNRRTNWKTKFDKKFIFEKNIYYAPFKVKKGKSKFFIREETPVRRTYGLFSYKTKKVINMLIKSPALSPDLKKKFEAVLVLWNEIHEMKREMRTLYSSQRALKDLQYENRANLKALGKRGNNDLRRTIVKSLAKVSSQLTKLNGKWVALNMKKGQKERRVQTLFKMITFTPKKKKK
jgi:hypothetical protein